MSPPRLRCSLRALSLFLTLVLVVFPAVTVRSTTPGPAMARLTVSYLPLVRHGLSYYRLAFTSVADHYTDSLSTLSMINVDGTGRIDLADTPTTRPPGSVAAKVWPPTPLWSPTGKQLAFLSDKDDSTGGPSSRDIYVINADGTGLRNLTNTPHEHERSPVWAPDGQKLAFSASGRLYVVNADGTGRTQLPDQPSPYYVYDSDPTWAPDGTKLAFFRTETYAVQIYVINADGTSPTYVTGGPPGWRPITGRDLMWSPAGHQLAFSAEYDIYVIGVDGTGLTNLTNTANEREAYPVWSPTGQKLAYITCSAPYKMLPVCGGINVMNADGSGNTKIGGGRYPIWSPDGQKFAFSAHQDLYVINADGTGLTNLTNTFFAAFEGDPAWEPWIGAADAEQ